MCHETATYVCLRERIRLHRNNPSSRLLVKPSIHTKELIKITEQSSRNLFSTWSSMCSSKSVTTLNNAYCLKSRDYEHGDRLCRLPWVKSMPLKAVAIIHKFTRLII